MGLVLAAPTLGVDGAAGETMTPFERAISTPRGQLKSPYPDFASVAAEGLKIYRDLTTATAAAARSLTWIGCSR